MTHVKGGAIRVQETGEPIELRVAEGPVQSCARRYEHSTLPFEGRRLVLVLFSLKAASRASADDKHKLLDRVAFICKASEPSDLEPSQFKAQAALRRKVLMQMKGTYEAMKAETTEEVAAGFLTGPYRSEQEVSDLLRTEECASSCARVKTPK